MSNTKDYTIETVASSSTEWKTPDGDPIVQAPFSLRPFSGQIRQSCVPYVAGPKTATEEKMRRLCFPTGDPQEIVLSLIASTSQAHEPQIGAHIIDLSLISSVTQVYEPNPYVSDVRTYTEIVSASNPDNTTAMQVGSVYLDARTYLTIGVLINDIKGGVGGSDVHTEFKRFTNGTTLLALSATNTAGNPFQYITSSNVVVSTGDWYDIYISASSNPATSSIHGVYYDY